jgi:putative NIF3 family GTP cyclohydrolase 1 type 2
MICLSGLSRLCGCLLLALLVDGNHLRAPGSHRHHAGMKSFFAGAFLFLLPLSAVSQTITAAEAIHRIQQRYPHPVPDTVDTIKAGDPATPVTGIATTFLDTMEVLKEANRRGLNLVISHEPTFYNHRDDTTFFADDPVYKEKRAFIEQHHMVVFRLHDEIHETAPDHIELGLLDALGWQGSAKQGDPFHVTIPATNLETLAKQLQGKLKASITMRVVGDPKLMITHIAIVPGAAGLETQVSALRPDEVELEIAGEASEWETVEYVRDAVNQGRHKALILLGHEPSEEPGMEKCAEDLRAVFPGMKVEHVVAGNALWLPAHPPK